MIVGLDIDHTTADTRASDTVSMVTRINRMTPATSENLTNFLKAFNDFDAFFLMPAQPPATNRRMPEIEALLKRRTSALPGSSAKMTTTSSLWTTTRILSSMTVF